MNTNEKETNRSYLTLGFLVLCALALAIVPALMIWHWEMMSLSDPSVVIGLIVSWIVALVILIVCGWYYRQVRARRSAAAKRPAPTCTPATEQ